MTIYHTIIYLVEIVYYVCTTRASYDDVIFKKPYNIDHAMDIFKEYSSRFIFNFKNETEVAKHYEIFTNNLRKINALNDFFHERTGFGLNMFTILDFEMVSSYYTGFNKAMVNGTGEVYKKTGFAPQSLDWRSTVGVVSPVREQEPCLLSYVYSAVDQIESQYALLTWRTKSKNKIKFHLSAQQAFDCEPLGDCTNGGVPHLVMQALKEQGGVMVEEDYYTMAENLSVIGFNYKFTCVTEHKKVMANVTEVKQLDVENEEGLKDALAFHGPLAITIYVSDSLSHYESGIFQPFDCDNATNHAVLLVGYGEAYGMPYWIIKNSWGQEWGRDGFLYLVRGKKACNIGEYVATTTVEIVNISRFN